MTSAPKIDKGAVMRRAHRDTKPRNDLSAEHVRSVFDYDAESGVFAFKYQETARAQWNGKCAGKSAGWRMTSGYIGISVGGRQCLAHRLAWLWMTGEWPALDIDHINGERDDNRWCNLREATRRQNIANSHPSNRNSSGVKGVSWCKRRNKWRATIRRNDRYESLGYFIEKDDAAKAYAAASRDEYGEFSKTSVGSHERSSSI